nr:hypothetical protein HK105_000332 [Polyrhizophydium stewartii]
MEPVSPGPLPEAASPVGGAPAAALGQRPRWRKLLYIRQDYPDNYVDKSFLKLMKRNVNVRQLDYWDVVCETFRVSQQLSVTVIFVAAFLHLDSGSVPSVTGLIAGSCAISACLAALFFTMLLGLTPILKNLTENISSDSIWFMAIVMLLANLLFHDYGSGSSTHTRFPDSLSINAAMFSAVLLASQLESNNDVFGLMLLAVQLFALFPILRRSMRAWHHPSVFWDGFFTVVLVIFAVALLLPISHASVTFYTAAIAFVTFFCPYMLVSIQKYKSEIRGPWDEAVIGH